MARAKLSGHWGEAVAAEYLRSRHYKILACNYHTRFGEIDLIARSLRHIVFVEVKTRRDAGFAQGREFVTGRKQDRIRVSAQIWLETNETGLQPRFDVIEVYAPEGMRTREPKIIHLKDAF